VSGVLDLARPELRDLEPYVPVRSEERGATLLMHANESPWPPPHDGGRALNRYPDPEPAALAEALADLYGVPRSHLLVVRGSDEGIDLLTRAFCRSGRDAVVVLPPTFEMYAHFARLQGARVRSVPLDGRFAVDVPKVEEALRPDAKILYLCTPNNPTGGVVPHAVVERLARATQDRALLVVDEAYVEFADAPSCTELLPRYEHLVVLRTLSKAWALAGARLGAVLAAPSVAAFLRRLMPPYPLPTPSVDSALAALDADGRALVEAHVAIVRRERARVSAALGATTGVEEVLPSQANFLTFRCAGSERVDARLRSEGVLLRAFRTEPRMRGFLRLSLGLPDENDRALGLLARALEDA
jgi:histidinol-phosphate aminotransferase